MLCNPPLKCANEAASVVLLARGGSARRRAAGSLRYAQVAGSARLRNLVDDQLESCVAPAGVEENRLVDGAVLLLEALVLRQGVDGELILLRGGALQLDLHPANPLPPRLAHHPYFIITAPAPPTTLAGPTIP